MPSDGARQADMVTPRPDAATAPRRIVVGVSGATGVVYAARLLEVLRQAGTETHLVVTPAAGMTRACETDMSAEDLRALADVSYPIGDLTAPISSGSFRTMGMIVAPCSMRSLAEIAYGMTSNLLTRAADVTLKERRRLVLMARETPLSMTHLRAMIAVTESGGIVAPPVPAFYTRPESLDDIVNHTIARLLDLFDIDTGAPRWGDEAAGLAATRAEHNGRKA